MKIAVVADVHLHDLHGGYGTVEAGSGEIALRTFADTMASTRIFNESYPAFIAVLDDIVRRGIRDVVLLGDYSDDGQVDAVSAVKALLSSYEERHGLRFFATFGNHDCYGPAVRHQGKVLTGRDGTNPVLVASDGQVASASIIQPGMRGMSTLEAMQAMAPYGVSRPPDVLHWETPFANHPELSERHPKGRDLPNLDASYLVEPQQDLWLLMLDANVFQQIDGVWQVRSNAAWDHVLDARAYLLEWIAGIARRASQTNKVLLAFSHYPALPLALTGDGEQRTAACTRDWLKRMPSLESGRKLAQAGIRWHFSGHMHVSGRTEMDGLINIAVPSPVAFPGGYMVLEMNAGQPIIEQVPLTHVPDFDAAFPAYRKQSRGEKNDGPVTALNAPTYRSFLMAHLHNLILTKHLPNDWPADLHSDMGKTVTDVFRNDSMVKAILEALPTVGDMPFLTMIEDYYFLRATGSSALTDLPHERVRFYREIKRILSADAPDISASRGIRDFLRLFAAYV